MQVKPQTGWEFPSRALVFDDSHARVVDAAMQYHRYAPGVGSVFHFWRILFGTMRVGSRRF